MYVEEVVGEVEALGSVGQGGSLFEDGGYGDVGEAGGYGLPFFAGSEVGVEFYVAVVEWFEFFRVEVPFACCGKPEVVGDEAGGDDGGFFAFDDGDGFVGVGGEEVFSEEALVEVVWVDVEGFVYPGYVVEGVPDSFAGLGVVEHDFAASDVVVLVYLPEDGCGGPVF